MIIFTAGHVNLLSRKDLFYAASIENLEEYKSNPELFRGATSLPHRQKLSVGSSVPDDETGFSGYRETLGENWEELSQGFKQQNISCIYDESFQNYFPTISKHVSAEIKHSLGQMLDMELLRNPIFMLFGVSNVLTSLGTNAPLIFLPHRAEIMGIDGEAWLLASFGVSNTIGRLIIGIAHYFGLYWLAYNVFPFCIFILKILKRLC